MEVDDVLIEIGEFGRSQKIMLSLYCLFNMCGAATMLLNIFIAQKAVINGCLTNPNIKGDFCSSSPACTQFSYQNGSGFSIATEWDLVCEDKSLATNTQSLFMLGVCIGSILTGPAADMYGRFRVFSLSTVATAVFSALTAASQSWSTHVLYRFCTGLVFNGMMGVGFVLVTEMLGPTQRALAGSLPALAFALGECLLAGAAWILPGWRLLCLAVAIWAALQIPLVYGFFYESPRWHLKKGNSQEGLRVLQSMARVNGTRLATLDLKVETDRSAQKESAFHLLKSPILRKLTVIQCLSWFANSFVYYGLTFSAGEIGSNIYSNVALLALVEVPANLFALFIMKRYGRVWSTSFFMYVCGFGLLATMAFPSILKTMVILSKSAITLSFAVIYVHAGEVYPTGVRNAGLSLLTLFNRIAGVLAPMSVTMMVGSVNINLLVYGAIAIISATANLYLPETFNKPLPDTDEDVLRLIQGGAYSNTNESTKAPLA